MNPGKPFYTCTFLESLRTSILTHTGGKRSKNKITMRFCLLPALVALEILQGNSGLCKFFFASPIASTG